MTQPWPPGSATGIGSLPGTDIREAIRVVLGELPDLPHLPELPARGAGADLIGRGAGLLVDLPVELYAARWRVARRPGRDLRVTRDLLERDVEALAELAGDHAGAFKLQAAGPWTLAASVELAAGEVILRDAAAVHDLASSLAEGLRGHVAELASRLPAARLVLQLDEPSLPAVLAGRVPTASGFGTLRPVDEFAAQSALAQVIDTVGVPVVVHCCAPGVPVDVIRGAGAAGIGLDVALLSDLDPLGEVLEAGLGLIAGVVDTRPPSTAQPPSPSGIAEGLQRMWRQLGLASATLPAQVVVSPACGLAGSPAGYARSALTACREAAQRLAYEATP